MSDTKPAKAAKADAPAPFLAPVTEGPVQEGFPTAGLSQSVGLQELPGSKIPGTDVSHVFGPGQTPCDPIAAGLDTAYHPLTAHQNRVVTQTGEFAAGQRPSTYPLVEGKKVRQAGLSDHTNVPAQ